MRVSEPTLSSMSDYRIEKVRRRVEVTLASGQVLEGDIFLQAFARFRPGPEEPLDVLNDADSFLPLRLASGELLVVQKAHIAVVATTLPEGDDAVETGLVGMHISVTLAHGGTVTGSLFPEVRADRPRLVDFLNSTPLRFFPLYSSDRQHIVATAHIAFAHPGD
jgi:hypothetical protein